MGKVTSADANAEFISGDDPVCVKGNGWEICPYTKKEGDSDAHDEETGIWLGEYFLLD